MMTRRIAGLPRVVAYGGGGEADPPWPTASSARSARCGTTISPASAGVRRGYSALITRTARAPPMIWAAMNGRTDEGAIPANVSENIRPTVIAGLAKLVEEVKKYAAPM